MYKKGEPYFEVIIPEREVRFSFACSGGKGGQNVNKVNSKAILEFDIDSSRSLTSEQKEVARTKAKYRTGDGHIIIHCDSSRSQIDNRRMAMDRLNEHLTELLTPQEQRLATKPTRASKIRRVEHKRQRSKQKALRKTRHEY